MNDNKNKYSLQNSSSKKKRSPKKIFSQINTSSLINNNENSSSYHLMSNFKSTREDSYYNTNTNTHNMNNNNNKYSLHKHNTSSFGHEIKSKYLLVVSIFFMSLSLLFIKILFHSHHAIPHSHNTLNFFCGFYIFIFSMIFTKIDNIDLTNKKNFNKGEIDYLIIRGLLGFLYNYFKILALQNMRLISAVTLVCLSPIVSTFIVMNQNREKIKRNDKLFLLLAFLIITIFIVQDYSYEYADEEKNSVFEDSLLGVIYCIIAAVLNSINSIIDKKICSEFHSYSILFVTGVFSMVLSPIFMAISGDKFFMGTRNFMLFFLLGASSFFGYYFNHKTIEANNLLINSSLQNITILLSYIYTIFVFDEPFTEYDIFASSLIIFINFYMKQRVEECEDIENL